MLRVYTCVVQEHDLRLVVVAGVICLFSSLIAFSAFDQALRDRPRRTLWTGLAAVVAGLGIWATHFVAMLAYQPQIPVGYDVATTLASVGAAVLVSGAGWTIALNRHPLLTLLGGAVVGAGVATMHYIGMAAVEVAGFIVWDRTLVTASVIFGVVMAALAVRVSGAGARRVARLAPVLLTLAICGLHFTAMAAASIYPTGAAALPAGTVDSATLAVAVTTAISLILLAGFGVVAFERKLARVQMAEAEHRAALAEQILRGAEERETLTAQLRREAELSGAALENMTHGLSVFDEHDRLVTYNRKYAELYGIPEHLLVAGAAFADICSYLVANGVMPDRRGSAAEEDGKVELALLDGRIIEVRQNPMPSGGRLSTHVDVTEARKAAHDIAYLATHDGMTGLPNRFAFADSLAAALAESAEPRLAVLTIDLDRFKEVNDTLGHAFGDEILKDSARRLRRLAGEDAVITRLGGDEFAVLLRTAGDTDVAARLGAGIIDELSLPFEFDGHTVVIGASVGVSLAPSDSTDGGELLKMSDLALYRAKEESRGTFRLFEPEMDLRLRERRELEADLRVAIREGQFEVYYQPLLDLASGTIRCFEALVRWHHPTRGVVQPMEFIPIAEHTSLIIPIGEWVLRQACRDAAAWPEEIRVAVNLSAAQFKRGDLIAVTINALASAGLSPERLELEITESVLLNDEVWVRRLLERLQKHGVRIVLDDFGTGYSSLSYLRTFPFSKIKIDRSFVADLVSTSDSLAIVQATIQLSEKLGMETTAEGVENAEQYDILVSEGCTNVQGFHVSRPVPIGQVPRLLARYAPECLQAAGVGAG